MHVDFGARLGEDQRLDSLSSSLIFDQNRPRAWHREWLDDGKWPREPKTVTDGTTELARPKLSTALERVYGRVRPDD